MQHATADLLIFGFDELIAYCSTFTELVPGDVIVTGTPGGVGAARTPPVFMDEGDLIEIERITRVAHPLFLGRTFREYLRHLCGSRVNPKRFMAMLGYKTFDNLAGWFVFSGRRK